MWILRIIWTDGTESVYAYATKKRCEAEMAWYKIGFGAIIKGFDIYKRSDVYYG